MAVSFDYEFGCNDRLVVLLRSVYNRSVKDRVCARCIIPCRKLILWMALAGVASLNDGWRGVDSDVVARTSQRTEDCGLFWNLERSSQSKYYSSGRLGSFNTSLTVFVSPVIRTVLPWACAVSFVIASRASTTLDLDIESGSLLKRCFSDCVISASEGRMSRAEQSLCSSSRCSSSMLDRAMKRRRPTSGPPQDMVRHFDRGALEGRDVFDRRSWPSWGVSTAWLYKNLLRQLGLQIRLLDLNARGVDCSFGMTPRRIIKWCKLRSFGASWYFLVNTLGCLTLYSRFVSPISARRFGSLEFRLVS